MCARWKPPTPRWRIRGTSASRSYPGTRTPSAATASRFDARSGTGTACSTLDASAGDFDVDAVDIGGRVREQECDDLCDLMCRPMAAERHRLDHLPGDGHRIIGVVLAADRRLLGDLRLPHRAGADEPGGDGVDTNACSREVLGCRFRQADDGGFRGGVGGHVGRAGYAGHRCDIDDRAPVAAGHYRSRSDGENRHQAEHVDLDYTARVVEWVPLDRGEDALVAGVVDDTAQWTERADRVRCGTFVRHVERHRL